VFTFGSSSEFGSNLNTNRELRTEKRERQASQFNVQSASVDASLTKIRLPEIAGCAQVEYISSGATR
jgi:hypothetical protein